MNDKVAKKVFLCGDFKFPRGDAVANRMQYIAKSLIETGYSVMIISTGINRDEDFNQKNQIYYFDGIPYKNVKRRKGNGFDFFLRGKNTSKILLEQNISSQDALFISSIWPHYTMFLVQKLKSDLPEFFYDVMEWFQPYQFKGGKLNLWYQAYNFYFEKIAPRGKRVMVISEELEHHFKKVSKEVVCIPLVLAPQDYSCKERTSFSPINLIYPGNPKKDAFVVMLQGLRNLTIEERIQIKFHVTGVSKDTLIGILGENAFLLDELREIIQFHGWLDYKDLHELYNIMHFFLLAKEDNIVSRANFPSKVPELMSCGVVPIMNNVGDISNYLTNGVDCILYNNCDAEDCAVAIRSAMSKMIKEWQQMSRSARYCAEENFDYKAWNHRIADFFR